MHWKLKHNHLSPSWIEGTCVPQVRFHTVILAFVGGDRFPTYLISPKQDPTFKIDDKHMLESRTYSCYMYTELVNCEIIKSKCREMVIFQAFFQFIGHALYVQTSSFACAYTTNTCMVRWLLRNKLLGLLGLIWGGMAQWLAQWTRNHNFRGSSRTSGTAVSCHERPWVRRLPYIACAMCICSMCHVHMHGPLSTQEWMGTRQTEHKLVC